MADRVGPAAIDDRPAADIGETGDRVDGRASRPDCRTRSRGRSRAAARTPRPSCSRRRRSRSLTAGLAPPSRPAVSGMPLWVHKRRPSSADSTSSAFSTLTAKTRPSVTVGGACSGAVTFWRQITLPSAGSSASDLTVSGRHEQPIVPEARAAAEGAAAFVLGLQIDRPDAAAGGGIEGADLCCPVHRENPAGGDDRRRQNPGIARGALADTGLPGASRAGPAAPGGPSRASERRRGRAIRVDLGRRQRDRDLPPGSGPDRARRRSRAPKSARRAAASSSRRTGRIRPRRRPAAARRSRGGSCSTHRGLQTRTGSRRGSG